MDEAIDTDEDYFCDGEVQYYLQDLAKKDPCICRKYAKRKLCNLCSETDIKRIRTQKISSVMQEGVPVQHVTDVMCRPARPSKSLIHRQTVGQIPEAVAHQAVNVVRTHSLGQQSDKKVGIVKCLVDRYSVEPRAVLTQGSSHTKRIKPVVIPAEEFISRYYLPELMKSGGTTPLGGIPTSLQKHLQVTGPVQMNEGSHLKFPYRCTNDVMGRFAQLNINNNTKQ